MNNIIKSVMSGKKKITAGLILPILAVVLNYFAVDEELSSSILGLIGQFAPALITMIAGWTYSGHEAKVDEEREKTKQIELTRGPHPVESRIDDRQAQQVLRDMADEEVAGSFDTAKFTAGIEERAEQRYVVLNPCTVLYSMWDKGKLVTCRSHTDLCLYADLLREQTEKCFEHVFGFPHSEAEEHLQDDRNCPYYSVENMARQRSIHHWRALRELRSGLENQRACEEMDVKGIPWTSLYDDSLFVIWELAPNLVSRSSQ